jgi:GNAT acetyltransferase-like protein
VTSNAPGVLVSSSAPDDWHVLLASDPSASPSHRPELWEALAATIPSFEWRVLTLREDGLVGGAPVVISRRGPFRWLHALPWLLPAAPLARPGAHARVDDALCGAFADLAHELRAVGGDWSFYRPGGPAPAAEVLARVPGETRFITAAILPLSDGLEVLRTGMQRKQRQALDQARERAWTFAEDGGALDEAHALHLAQSRGWPGHVPVPLELSRRLLRSGTPDAPVARLFTLRSSRELVATTLALDGPHETFVWWSGMRPEGRRTHAFLVLLWLVAEWAAARGRRRLNLGASGGLSPVSAFKSAFGATEVRYPVRWLSARHATFAGRSLAALQAWRRRGRAMGEAM